MKHLNPKPLNPSFCFSSGEAPAADAPEEEEQEEEQEVVKTASGWEDFLIWRGGTLNLRSYYSDRKTSSSVRVHIYIYIYILYVHTSVCVYIYINMFASIYV